MSMDDVVRYMENIADQVDKKIDTLAWKIKKFETVLFSGIDMNESYRILAMMEKLTKTCKKYDEILPNVNALKNDHTEFTNELQIRVDLLKSKIETLRALATKGRGDSTI